MRWPRLFPSALLVGLWLCGSNTMAADQLKAEAKARFSHIEQLLDDWDVVKAREELDLLAQRIPGDIEPLKYFQGRLAFEEGRYDEAQTLLQAANMGDKPGSYLRLAKDTLAVTRQHRKAESAHFIVLYPAGKDEVLVPYALETLESIHRALKEDLGFAPVGKVRVEFVHNARELARVSTLTYDQIQTTGTIAICKFNKLMVTSPKAVVRGYDWQDTLAHEYVHLVVSQMSHNTVPIWLHEGLAKYLESRWRGGPGLALPPSTLALLGRRVKAQKLIPFEKMHPSIALLPTAEDAATAFAEVFFAVDFLYQRHGAAGLRTLLQELKGGATDKKAVEATVSLPFESFEKAWLAHVQKQPFPKELLPQEQVVLKDETQAQPKAKASKGREISFGDFAEISEVPARKLAHLGELLRERRRMGAAAEEFSRAHRLVGDKYESLSNKYALTLVELKRGPEAEKVLRGSLRVHPGTAQTYVHLGRILFSGKNYAQSKEAYLAALASDPFDPEIHLALTRIHQVQGNKALAERTRQASALLTGLPLAEVDRLVTSFLPEQESPPASPQVDGGPSRDG